jgi:basic membrane protein A
MLQPRDNAAHAAFTQRADPETGNVTMGIANGGIDYALDEHNAAIFTDEMKAAVDKAKAAIVDGSISVHDYRSDNTCPVM